jgi:hypothetical protein
MSAVTGQVVFSHGKFPVTRLIGNFITNPHSKG